MKPQVLAADPYVKASVSCQHPPTSLIRIITSRFLQSPSQHPRATVPSRPSPSLSSVTTQSARVSLQYDAMHSVALSNGVLVLQASLSSSVEAEGETEEVGWPCWSSGRQWEWKRSRMGSLTPTTPEAVV